MRKICIAAFLAIAMLPAKAQNIGIGTATPDNSAQLHIHSETKGLLIPRMDSTTRKGIVMPAAGLMVYDSSYKALFINTGTAAVPAWQPALSPSTGWSLQGNSGTDTARHALGTMDQMPLFLRSNGAVVARFIPGQANYFIGQDAGQFQLPPGGANTGVGHLSLSPITTGSNNTAVGYRALAANTTGRWNTVIGSSAGDNIISGWRNTALGYAALTANDSSNENTAIGQNALLTLRSASSFGNTTVGSQSLTLLQNGSYNTALGFRADVRGSASQPSVFRTNATAIGALSVAQCDYCLVLGARAGINGAMQSVKVGIGVTAPEATFHVANGGFDASTNNLVLLENLESGGVGIRYKNLVVPSNLWQTYVGQDGKFKIGREMMSDPLTIDVNGNIGINKVNPALALDIEGDLRISGAAYVGTDLNVPGLLDVNGNIKVDGVIMQDAVASPSLAAGWVAYGSGFTTPGYYRDKEKRVYLQGMLKNISSPTGFLFTLPVGFRPAAIVSFIVASSVASGHSRIDIDAAGNVSVNIGAGALPGPSGFVGLDGISFRVN